MWSDFFHGICSFRLFSKGGVRRNGAVCLRRPILFCLARKEWGEKRRWGRGIALSRLKNLSFHFASCRFVAVVKTPFGRPTEFLLSKISLRQIFMYAKSKSICLESMRRFSGFARFCLAVSIGCGRETSQVKRPKVRGSGATAQ